MSEETLLIVGLGNPGQKYIGTRHNAGAALLQQWLPSLQSPNIQVRGWEKNQDVQGDVAEIMYTLPDGTNRHTYVLLPLTFMNNSGQSVAVALDKYKVPVANLIVVHDDVELALGKVKVKLRGSAAGHNGVRSIHASLQSDEFMRIRLGVGKPSDPDAMHGFVLEKFSLPEQPTLKLMNSEAIKLLTQVVEQGKAELLSSVTP